MRRQSLILLIVLAIGMTACSQQEPEVVVNEQVPAAQAVAAEPEGGAEGAEGAEGGAAVDFASADAAWTAEQLAFTDAPAEIPAGEVVIGLEIVGGLPHNVIFESFEGDRILVEGAGEGTFASSVEVPAGTYTYYCGIAGHRAAGMEGQVTAA